MERLFGPLGRGDVAADREQTPAPADFDDLAGDEDRHQPAVLATQLEFEVAKRSRLAGNRQLSVPQRAVGQAQIGHAAAKGLGARIAGDRREALVDIDDPAARLEVRDRDQIGAGLKGLGELLLRRAQQRIERMAIGGVPDGAGDVRRVPGRVVDGAAFATQPAGGSVRGGGSVHGRVRDSPANGACEFLAGRRTILGHEAREQIVELLDPGHRIEAQHHAERGVARAHVGLDVPAPGTAAGRRQDQVESNGGLERSGTDRPPEATVLSGRAHRQDRDHREPHADDAEEHDGVTPLWLRRPLLCRADRRARRAG